MDFDIFPLGLGGKKDKGMGALLGMALMMKGSMMAMGKFFVFLEHFQ